MAIQQISIFLENKPGKLSHLANLFKEHEVNIRFLCISDTADFGIVRALTADQDKALHALLEAGYTARLTDMLAVSVPDSPGGLAHLVDTLNQGGLSIEYLYSYKKIQSTDSAIIVFRVLDIEKALILLRVADIPLLDEHALFDNE